MKFPGCMFIFLFCSLFCRADRFLNLDFEKANNKNLPIAWGTGGDSFKILLDSSLRHSGKYSLCIAGNGKDGNDYGACSSIFPLKRVKSKKVSFRGYIKTENIIDGNAFLWISASNRAGLMFYKETDDSPDNTTDWKKFTISVDISENATTVAFGCAIRGKGKAWFDDLQMYIDSIQYDDNINAPREPATRELNWLRTAAIPLRTNDMNSNDIDLQPLQGLLGNIKIVALGEESHGASDIFKMKGRLIKYLVEKENFNVFALEANMPEACKLNEYITEGKGDPKELILGMHYWAWDTQEMLEIVQWMRKYNLSHTRKIFFTGFDMQYYRAALNEVLGICNTYHDTIITASITKLGNIMDSIEHGIKLSGDQKTFVAEEWHVLKKFAGRLVVNVQHDWITQMIQILQQYYNDTDTYARDRFMADNLTWIYKHHTSDSKIIVWAHNGHIKKTDSAMGSYVFKALKNEYLPIGFLFHVGSYTAWKDGSLKNYKATASYPGTFEYYFHKAGTPMSLIDLRKIPAKNSPSNWITTEMDYRQVGKTVPSNEFAPGCLIKDFDMMLYIDKTTNSTVLHLHDSNE